MRRTGLFEYTEKRTLDDSFTTPALEVSAENAINDFLRLPKNHPDKVKQAERVKALALNGSTTAMNFFINALPAFLNHVSLLPSISYSDNQQPVYAQHPPTLQVGLDAMFKIAQEGKDKTSLWVARALFVMYAFEYMALKNIERPAPLLGLGHSITRNDQHLSFYFLKWLTMGSGQEAARPRPEYEAAVIEAATEYGSALSTAAIDLLVKSYLRGHEGFGIVADERQAQHWINIQTQLADLLLEKIKITFKLFVNAFLLYSPVNVGDRDFLHLAYSIHEFLTKGRELSVTQIHSLFLHELDQRKVNNDPDALLFYARSFHHPNAIVITRNLELAKHYYRAAIKFSECKQKAEAAYALCSLSTPKNDERLLTEAYRHGSVEAARDLGNLAWKRGDLKLAEQYFTDVLNATKNDEIYKSIYKILSDNPLLKSADFSSVLLNLVRLLVVKGYKNALTIGELYCRQLNDGSLEGKWHKLLTSYGDAKDKDKFFQRLDKLIDKTISAATDVSETKRSKTTHRP